MKTVLRKTVATALLGSSLALVGLAQPANALSVGTNLAPTRTFYCYDNGKAYLPGTARLINGEWKWCGKDGSWTKTPPIIIGMSSGYGQ
jgi:hypothetical protein